jgi:hypothetical protein
VQVRAAPVQTIGTHGVIDVATVDVTTAKGGGGDMWGGASRVKAEVVTVDGASMCFSSWVQTDYKPYVNRTGE